MTKFPILRMLSVALGVVAALSYVLAYAVWSGNVSATWALDQPVDSLLVWGTLALVAAIGAKIGSSE